MGKRWCRKTTNRLRAIETRPPAQPVGRVPSGRKTTNRLRAIETSGLSNVTPARVASRKTTNRLRAIETTSPTFTRTRELWVARQRIACGRLKHAIPMDVYPCDLPSQDNESPAGD